MANSSRLKMTLIARHMLGKILPHHAIDIRNQGRMTFHAAA
jgi:hypothetical protein